MKIFSQNMQTHFQIVDKIMCKSNNIKMIKSALKLYADNKQAL